jgi:hypothetical protein
VKKFGGEIFRARVPRYFEALQRAFNIQGDLPQLIDPQVSAGIELTSLDRDEYAYLQRKTRFEAGNNLSAGGAGVSSVHEFENPTSSNMLAEVEVSLQQNGAVAFQVILSVVNSAAGGLAVGNRTCNLDTRQTFNTGALTPNPVCIVRSANLVLAAINGPIYQLGVPDTKTVRGIILTPGWFIRVQPFTLNQGVAAGFRWSERPLTPQE